ncbi:MAG: NHL repeat-containing protein [Spirochaetes bacterium]|nr:NHL repeat-containing protein [Spirochaetota bacterium]MBU0956154.1 NHL repeat-containing protein [Spirochaetota bacterium]
MKRLFLSFGLFILCFSIHAQYSFQLTDPPSIANFRIAVEAYNRGRFAESLYLFESVLSANPGNQLTLYWLGKAYQKLGLGTNALDFWRQSVNGNQANSFVEARSELLALIMRSGLRTVPARLIENRSIEGIVGKDTLFLRPSWIHSFPDGSVLVVANGSNEILRINPNGLIVERYTGGISGLDRPFALSSLPGGGLVVSEFMSDRLTFLDASGRIQTYAPLQQGQERLVGPQYLAVDADGFMYVSDIGRSRVVKLAPDGKFIAGFTAKAGDFQGLIMPTGIAVMADRLYVADAALKAILVMDLFGNLLDTVAGDFIQRPEGLTSQDGYLLIADSTRIVAYDPESGDFDLLYTSSDRRTRLVCAVIDANGDLLAADYNASRILLLSDPVATYSGLYVDVERIYADRFPQVFMDIRIMDNAGRPVVGLDASNFYAAEFVTRVEDIQSEQSDIPVKRLVETIKPVSMFSFEGSLDASSAIELQCIVPAAPELSAYKLAARDALSAVVSSLGTEAQSNLILAGAVPQPPISGSLAEMNMAISNMKADSSWRFDLALRLAVNELADSSSRRAIAFISTGSINEEQLDDFSLAELVSLLRNNRISLHVIQLGRGELSPGLRYLMEESEGQFYSMNQPDGVSELGNVIRSMASGVYRVSFRSAADTDFGRRYLQVRTEVYFRARSGKDETGYFAPLQ